jgi:deazaflavin-dependent oxidoreductase (nitroreductase family)
MLRLHAIGRRSGQERVVILGYYEDGPNLVTLAMNGWGDPPPAWWLNLSANPDARVDLVDGARAVRARAAEGDERDRLWTAIRSYDGYGDIDALSARRSTDTSVVVLEPR